MLAPFDVMPAGDAALLVQLPARIDPELNAWCVALSGILSNDLGAAISDVVIGYCSVMVYYDPLIVDGKWLEAEVRDRADALDPDAVHPGGLVEVPVEYGGDAGPDLADVASFAGCSEREVVDLHASTEYRVYLVGFVPGFAYMAEVNPRIAAPRRSAPRLAVPAGSVAIAGGQTGIYPSVTPGGWNIIGRTSLVPYDPTRQVPCLFRPGDRVRFRPASTFERSSG
jgi:inhibitor of KinA